MIVRSEGDVTDSSMMEGSEEISADSESDEITIGCESEDIFVTIDVK